MKNPPRKAARLVRCYVDHVPVNGISSRNDLAALQSKIVLLRMTFLWIIGGLSIMLLAAAVLIVKLILAAP
jgi:hypothetical protein